MREDLAELWRFRYLLYQMVRREIKVRYKNSVFGFCWSIVPPLLQVLVYTFLFRSIMGVRVGNYSAYLLCGIIPWTFFQVAILDSSQSLLQNFGIIRKIYLPREIIPLACVCSNFIHFLLGWAVYFSAFFVVLRLIGFGTPVLPTMVWFPIIVGIETLLVTGLALFFSALNVFYEDVKFMLQTLFNLLFFLMPILYPADIVFYSATMQKHPWLFKLYMLNPVAAIIEAFRKTMLQPADPGGWRPNLYGKPPLPLHMILGYFALACLTSVIVAWLGYAYFNRRKWQFVERP